MAVEVRLKPAILHPPSSILYPRSSLRISLTISYNVWMGYTEKLLGANEKILNRTRRHPFTLLSGMFKELIILTVLITGYITIREWPDAPVFFPYVIVALAILTSLSMVGDFLRWQNEVFIVTTHRVLHVSGVFSKRVLDSSLNKINDVILQQSWFGRIFGYGTIKILTASDEVINTLDRISDPIAFKQAMLNAKSGLEPSAVIQTAQASSTQLLEELAQLKSRNMITEEEYQEKRKEILRRM